VIFLLASVAAAGDSGLRDFAASLESPASSLTVCTGLDQLPGLAEAIQASSHPQLDELDLSQTLYLGVGLGFSAASFVPRGGQRELLEQDAPLGQALGDFELLEPHLDSPGPEGTGCLSLTSVRLPDGSGLVMEYRIVGGEVSTLRTHGLELPPEVYEVWRASSPRIAARGRSRSEPVASARLNVDPEPLLRLVASSGRAPSLGEALDKVEGGGIDLAPGAEIGMLSEGVVVILPLRRPLRASWALRRMKRHLRREGRPILEAEGLLLIEEGLFLAARGRSLVLGMQAQAVHAVLEGEGDAWLSPDLASRPGVSVAVDMDRLPALEAMPTVGQQLLGRTRVHADLSETELEVELWIPEVAGLVVGWMGPATTPPDPVQVDPVGSPPSTEALSVLMLLRQAEERALLERGQYLPYSGGPRELDELDGESVPWPGIPELGVGPMDTACRYEITLGGGGFTARSLCDEDGDGKVSITVVGPGALPARITPPDVR
jgi:hypothetical protein